MNLSFKSNEQYLAWTLHKTQEALREALQMPKIMLHAAIQAVMRDNQNALKQSGYTKCPQPTKHGSDQ